MRTHTVFKLAHNTFRVPVPTSPGIGLAFRQRFGCKQRLPAKQHTLESCHSLTGSWDTGKAEDGSSSTLQDTDKDWETGPDEWKDGTIYITAGKGVGNGRTIILNTADTITVSPEWDQGKEPDNTSWYLIHAPNAWTVLNDLSEPDNATGPGQLPKLTWNLE